MVTGKMPPIDSPAIVTSAIFKSLINLTITIGEKILAYNLYFY